MFIDKHTPRSIRIFRLFALAGGLIAFAGIGVSMYQIINNKPTCPPDNNQEIVSNKGLNNDNEISAIIVYDSAGEIVIQIPSLSFLKGIIKGGQNLSPYEPQEVFIDMDNISLNDGRNSLYKCFIKTDMKIRFSDSRAYAEKFEINCIFNESQYYAIFDGFINADKMVGIPFEFINDGTFILSSNTPVEIVPTKTVKLGAKNG
jgi:hypothetical protein